MYKYSQRSLNNLSSCHIQLQKLFHEVIKYWDCAILEGHRGETAQNEAFNKGLSKLKYPNSKHNKKPSLAVDVVPYPINWNNHKQMIMFSGFVLGLAATMGIKIRWGGDWNRNRDPSDETFIDYPHFEIDGE